jgi:hypothetical protein
MTYALWSGFNAEAINSTEINGAAPSPDLLFEGFNADIFPILMASFEDMHADVMRARAELRSYALQQEDRTFETSRSRTSISVLHEDRALGKERSRKDYP